MQYRLNAIPIILGCCAMLIAIAPCASYAQPTKSIAEDVRTELKFELLLPRERANGLAAQQWGQIFNNLGVPLQVRQPLFNDKAGVEQDSFGTFRRVTATGLLDRSGMIVFPHHKFRQSDVAQLAEWIEDLKMYGAQGAPEGQPLWGLSQLTFDALHKEMTQLVPVDTSGMSLSEALIALDLPQKYPIKFSAQTREILPALADLETVPHNLTGFAKGTALAIILRGYGLSYGPARQPDESIALLIEPSEEIAKAWPIGWDPASLGLKRLTLAREFYLPVAIEIREQPLPEVISKIEEEANLNVFIDPLTQEFVAQPLNQMLVNYPRKRTSWSLCLRTIFSKLQLSQELRVDENNKPFLWITKFQPKSED